MADRVSDATLRQLADPFLDGTASGRVIENMAIELRSRRAADDENPLRAIDHETLALVIGDITDNGIGLPAEATEAIVAVLLLEDERRHDR